MINYDEGDMKTFVVESAINNNNSNREEIQLFERLSLAMELFNDYKFNIIEASINDGINFSITTRFPHSLPEDISMMFFHIDLKFNVNIKETSKYVYAGERHFDVNIKRDNIL